MPAEFEKAVKAGARVRLVKGPNEQFGLKKGEYMHVAFMKGKMYRGYVKKSNPAMEAMEKQEHGRSRKY